MRAWEKRVSQVLTHDNPEEKELADRFNKAFARLLKVVPRAERRALTEMLFITGELYRLHGLEAFFHGLRKGHEESIQDTTQDVIDHLNLLIIKQDSKSVMKNISRSFNQWCIKNQLREKYANQLKKNKELDINTAEGWNDRVKVSHSKNLIDRCIEPTEENLQKYQEEVEAHVKELQKKYPPKPIPVTLVYKTPVAM